MTMCCLQHRTLEAVLDRGENLDDLVGKSEELSLHSKAFYTTVGITSLCIICSSVFFVLSSMLSFAAATVWNGVLEDVINADF